MVEFLLDKLFLKDCPLVNINITMENHHLLAFHFVKWIITPVSLISQKNIPTYGLYGLYGLYNPITDPVLVVPVSHGPWRAPPRLAPAERAPCPTSVPSQPRRRPGDKIGTLWGETSGFCTRKNGDLP